MPLSHDQKGDGGSFVNLAEELLFKQIASPIYPAVRTRSAGRLGASGGLSDLSGQMSASMLTSERPRPGSIEKWAPVMKTRRSSSRARVVRHYRKNIPIAGGGMRMRS